MNIDYNSAPHLEGFVKLKPYERVLSGDVQFRVTTGAMLHVGMTKWGKTVTEIKENFCNTATLWFYRQAEPFNKRLPGNPIFSKELTLP